MDRIRQFRDLLALIETWFAAGSLLLLLLLALAQILSRNLFDAGLAQADTLTRYLVLYVTFFGAALAVDRERHIKIDVGCSFLSPGMLARLYRPMHLITALISGLFTHAAVRYWQDAWAYAPDHERWLVLVGLIVPLGFALIALHSLIATLLGKDGDACCPS